MEVYPVTATKDFLVSPRGTSERNFNQDGLLSPALSSLREEREKPFRRFVPVVKIRPARVELRPRRRSLKAHSLSSSTEEKIKVRSRNARSWKSKIDIKAVVVG
jgi:hypothetical protein